MAVPYTRIVSEAIESYGDKEASNNLAQYDGITGVFGLKGAIEFEQGGREEFRERTLYGQNTNIAARGQNAQITTVDDEGYTLITTPQRLVNGAIVMNQIQIDQVQGNAALAISLADDKIKQFDSSWVITIADLLRQATPGASDPYTLLPSGTTGAVNGILVARTPAQQGTDGATTAGISRGDNSWWRNQYSNTSFDLTSVAGRRGLDFNVYQPCTRGSGKDWQPNFGISGGAVMASLSASADNNRRGSIADGEMAAFGYDNIMFQNAAIIRDSSSRFLNGSASKVAFVNTKMLKVKVLKGAGKVSQSALNGRNGLKSLPIFWKHQMMSDIDTMNYVSVGYVTFNFVPKSLQDHGLADNCS